MTTNPSGEERQVKLLGGAAIDGAPIAYIVVLAAVVCALAFIPFSVVLASGGSFPMSQGVYALTGWILGPIAGAIASGVGATLGIFLAPHTAGIAPVTILGAVMGALAGGCMVLGQKRQGWWILPIVLVTIAVLGYWWRAIFVNGVNPVIALASRIVYLTGILLYALPTRTLIARWIHGKNIGLLAVGLFLGTWMCVNIMHGTTAVFSYWMVNYPEKVILTLLPIIPVEMFFRSLVGTVIGTGVITGLRAIGLVKPTEAIY